MGGRGSQYGTKSSPKTSTDTTTPDVEKLAKDFNSFDHYSSGYDGDSIKLAQYQKMDDDDAGHYLHVVDDVDVQNFPDKWPFYSNPYQKLLLDAGLNEKPTVLSDKDFDDYLNKTGQGTFYRGWSSDSSAQRFMESNYSHTGTGIYGDGIYFAESKGDAKAYGGTVTKLALSPKARIINLSDLRNMMQKTSSRYQRALAKAGSGGGSRSFGANDGESQYALKLGYNVIQISDYWVALTRDALVVSKTTI